MAKKWQTKSGLDFLEGKHLILIPMLYTISQFGFGKIDWLRFDNISVRNGRKANIETKSQQKNTIIQNLVTLILQ